MSRILLVDDDVSLLKLMSMRLRSQGYEVDTADSAEGALDRLRQQRADLVLSDLRMAGMDPMPSRLPAPGCSVFSPNPSTRMSCLPP